MKLSFYYKYSTNKSALFVDGCEVLLSPSIIAIRDQNDNIVSFYPENQTGKGFSDIVETLIADTKITKVKLLNTAYLQRHREKLLLLAKNCSEKEAKKKSEDFALQNWDKWQEQNDSAIKSLTSHYKENFCILNWNVLLQNDKFAERKKIADKLFNNGSGHQAKKFKKAINGLEKIFYNKISVDIEHRKKQFNSSLTREGITKSLREIALEECALRTILAFSYEIYRGQCNIAAEMFYDMYGEKGKMQFVTIGNDEEIKKIMETDKLDEKILNTKQKSKQSQLKVTSNGKTGITINFSINITVSDDKKLEKYILNISELMKQFGTFAANSPTSPTSPNVDSPNKRIEVK